MAYVTRSPRPRTNTRFCTDINLAKTYLSQIATYCLALPFLLLNLNIFSLNEHAAVKPTMTGRLATTWERPSRVLLNLHEMHGPDGATRQVDQSTAPDTVQKLLRVYKVERSQQQKRFTSCKHLSLALSLVNSFQFHGRAQSFDTSKQNSELAISF